MPRKRAPQQTTKKRKPAVAGGRAPRMDRKPPRPGTAELSASTGQNFFRSLTRHLATTLGVDFVFVGELTGPDKEQILSLGLYARGKYAENFRYDLAHTPCENVVSKGLCIYRNDVQRLFPKDSQLRELGVASYLGTSLRSATREVIGILVAMDRKPLKSPRRAERILESFAARAAAELERKQVEDAFRENEAFLRLSQKVGHVGSWDWDLATDKVRWSEEMLRIYGLDPEEFDGTFAAAMSRIHPEDLPRVEQDVQRWLQNKGSTSIEFRIVWPDGTVRNAWGLGELIYDGSGRPVRAVGTVQDVTERKRLDTEKQQLVSLVEHSKSFISLTSLDGRMVFLNRGGRTLVGLADAARVGEMGIGDCLMPQHRCEWRDQILPRLRNTGYWEGDINFSHLPTGAPIAVHVHVFAIKDPITGAPTIYAVTARDIRERKRAQQELIETHEALEAVHGQLAAIFENAPSVAMQAYDPDGKVVFWNRASEKLYGFTAADIVGKRLGGRVLAENAAREFEELIRQVLASDAPAPHREWETKTSSGESRWVMSSIFPIRFGKNQAQAICMDIDITAKKISDEEMRKLSSAIRQTADAVLITDQLGTIEYVNHAFEEITGFSAVEALGAKPSLVKSGVHDLEFYRRLWETILRGETFRDVFINRKKNGDLYYEEKTITPLKNDAGEITHFISTGKDITERMQAQERLQFLAHHDALTGLPNRILFVDRLSQTLIRAHWHERVVAVMFLDLDRFKTINDTLGHNVGDQFLQGIAARLATTVREGDTLARLGGDEFAIVLKDIAQPEDVSMVANKILNAFSQPYVLDDRELFITSSIGVSLYPTDGTDALTLLRNADAAMYRAKDLGKNNYQFYSADMHAMDAGRLAMESHLRRALERNEFLLYYQPQVDLHTGSILGMEALLRWRHPELGLITPIQFIALAEETGMIGPIGEWVARTALAQLCAWEKQGFGALRMAINVSGRQFNEVVFIDTINRLLDESGANPSQLELEITESVIMRSAQITDDKLRALRSLGVRFAIDDFGTGYSSLSYLRRFPINTLKIDKSFVSDVVNNQEDAEIVRTVVTMAHSLKLQVVAEGVETREALRFLREIGCDAIQGNYFSRPLPPDEITELLRAGKCLEADECGLMRASGADGGSGIPRR